jgi:transposase
MTLIVVDSNQVIIGVDTHKDNHVAFAINSLGVRLDDCIVPATLAGYEQLLGWAKALGQIVAFGVEGTGSYGSGLTRFLRRQGLKVIEVSRPSRRDHRRLQGKNDVLDAEQAARQVLSGQATAIPKSTDGAVEMMRIIRRRTRHRCQSTNSGLSLAQSDARNCGYRLACTAGTVVYSATGSGLCPARN